MSGVCCIYSSEGDTEQKRGFSEACTFVQEKNLGGDGSLRFYTDNPGYLAFSYPFVALGDEHRGNGPKDGYKLKIWDSAKNEVQTINTNGVYNLQFSPLNTYLAYQSDRNVYLLNLRTKKTWSFVSDQIDMRFTAGNGKTYLNTLTDHTPLLSYLNDIIVRYLVDELLVITHKSAILICDLEASAKNEKIHKIQEFRLTSPLNCFSELHTNQNGDIVVTLYEHKTEEERYFVSFSMIKDPMNCSAKLIVIPYKDIGRQAGSCFLDGSLHFLSDGTPVVVKKDSMDVFDTTKENPVIKKDQPLPFELPQKYWHTQIGFFKDKTIVAMNHRDETDTIRSSAQVHHKGKARETVLQGKNLRCRISENHIITKENSLVRLYRLTQFSS
jgi:hypothetical protein